MEKDINQLGEIITTSNRVTVLAGAGISAESGVPTFRGADGLWKKYRAEELATPGAFNSNPELVWEWYDWRRQLIGEAEPNPGHQIIAGMEEYYDDLLLIRYDLVSLRSVCCYYLFDYLHTSPFYYDVISP